MNAKKRKVDKEAGHLTVPSCSDALDLFMAFSSHAALGTAI